MKQNRVLAGMVAIAIASLSLQAGYVWAQAAQGKQQPAAQQGGTKATDKGTKGRGGADPNVKTESATNNPAQEPAAPPKKGGAQGRGIFDCWVAYDNYTPWYVEVFADGNYRGTMAPFGDITVNVGAGVTRVYARARFNDGSVITFGPRTFNCTSNGVFTWTLER